MKEIAEVIKHDRGYLIYTPDKIYLTDTGKLSEHEKLHERTETTYQKNKTRLRNELFRSSILIVISCSILFLFFPFIIAIPVALIATPILISTVLKTLQTDYKNLISIPTLKITKMDLKNNQLTIHFVNGDSLSDSVQLTGLDNEILTPLILEKFSN